MSQALLKIIDSRSFTFKPHPLDWLVGIAVLILLVPVAWVAINLAKPIPGVWSHLADTVLGTYLLNSLWLALGVGGLVALGGVGTAWLVTMCRFPGSRVLEWALLLPMAMPAYVVAYTYTGLLDFAGPVQTSLRALMGWRSMRDYWFPEVRSLGGAIVVMALVLYPYVYLMVRAAFLTQSVCVLEASRTLGQSPWRAFFRVALPLARPAVAAGVTLALMETLSDFGTVQYFAVDTFTTGIYRTWMALGQPGAALQLGAILMLFVVALIAFERLSRGDRRFHHTTGRYRRLPRIPLTGWRMLVALGFCLFPIVVGFAVPAGVLGWWIWDQGFAQGFGRDFAALAGNSLLVAGLAGAITVAIGLLLAYAQRLHPVPLVTAGVRAASLGYAVPGAVIAVGALVPLAAFDHGIIRLVKDFFGADIGLLTTGTMAGLLYAYVVRFLAVALNGIESALGKVTRSMDAAARSLGAGTVGMLRRVHVPMISGGLLTAGLLVFVDVLKELPATLIVRPFNFDTLATRAFSLASDERLAQAGGPSLAIVLVGLIPVIMLSLAIARSRPGEG